LQNGYRGDKVRVRVLDTKKVFKADVVARDCLKVKI
jgi:flagella basal body P-ring formation protein FlgA